MLVLGSKELAIAEDTLRLLFPESIKVYGCLFSVNRGKAHNIQVIVDSWPDFKAIVCKPKEEGTCDREGHYNIHSVYSKDKESLKKLLSVSGVLNWNTFTLIAGVDINHLDAVKELAVLKHVPSKTQVVMHVLMLTDINHLNAQKRNVGCTMRPLTSDDATLVNQTWKYGGEQSSLGSVLSYISRHPSLCVLAEAEPAPVSWLLLYHHCALGLLYTRPEHRNRGYAKLLIASMAERLLQQGYPVYCFVEDGNDVSYKLFTSLGFTHKPGYRSVWFELHKHGGSS